MKAHGLLKHAPKRIASGHQMLMNSQQQGARTWLWVKNLLLREHKTLPKRLPNRGCAIPKEIPDTFDPKPQGCCERSTVAKLAAGFAKPAIRLWQSLGSNEDWYVYRPSFVPLIPCWKQGRRSVLSMFMPLKANRWVPKANNHVVYGCWPKTCRVFFLQIHQ